MGYTHGRKWADEDIEKEILNIVESLKIDYFPTHEEMMKFTGGSGLRKAVTRKGSLYWSEKLGLPLKSSDTQFGNKYEMIASDDIYEHTGFHSIWTSTRHPYDLLTDNSVKIDIKVSKPFTNNCNAKAYTFNLEKREPTCDIFILYCVNDDETIEKVLIIPSCSLLGQTQLGVGKTSRWDKYKDKWDYIEEYSSFHRKYMFN